MNKQIRWLLTEIERWEADGLVSTEQARRLRERYKASADGTSWGTVVFASAGAVVVGLGVILMLAYNWDEIPKFGKLTLVFASVATAHFFGLRWEQRSDWWRQLGAAMNLLGTMCFGAGIWLIAQIYHIDEHYPNGFLFWGLGALAMAWALESVLQGLLATVLFAIWGGCESFAFRDPNLWALPLLVLTISPLAWRRQSALLLGVLLAAVQFLLLANLTTIGAGAHMLTSSLAWGAFLVAVARLMAGGGLGFAGGGGVASGFGYLTTVFCAYVLSFNSGWRYVMDWEQARVSVHGAALTVSWVLFALAVAAWALVTVRVVSGKLTGLGGEEWVVPVALIYSYALVWGRYGALAQMGAHPFTLMLVGIAAAWMWQGCRDGRLKPTLLGSLLFALVVLARYFDLFQSLATRGLAFVILGGVFIAEGIYFRKRRAVLATEKAS